MHSYLHLKPSEYDQEIPQSQTNPWHPWHREEETENTNSHMTKVKQPAFSSSVRWLFLKEGIEFWKKLIAQCLF